MRVLKGRFGGGKIPLIVLALLLPFLIAEVILRALGFPSYSKASLSHFVSIEPPGHFFQPHPTLGFTHVPGEQKLIAYGKYQWVQHHGSDALRVMPTTEGTKRDVWIFGCSFTHGYGVNDDETYPFHLQELLNDARVTNFGTDGYSTVQMLLQYQVARRERKPPALVIMGHIGEHSERDALLQSRRKILSLVTNSLFDRIPFARLGSGGDLLIQWTDMRYNSIPGASYSALINLVDEALLAYSHTETFAITEKVIEKFAEEVKEDGAEFIVAGLRYDAESMMGFCSRRGIKHVYAWIDSRDPKMVMASFDDHPSASGHREIAELVWKGIMAQSSGMDKASDSGADK